MTKQNKSILKTLLKYDNKALKEISDGVKIDYNKPIFIEEICGAFTLNKLNKVFNLTNKKVLLIIYAPNYRPGFKPLYYVILDKNNLDITFNRIGLNWDYFDDFYKKADFEKCRKSATKTLIIAQDRDYLRPQQKKTCNIYLNEISGDTQRVKVKSVHKWSHYYGGESYISGADLIKINGDNGKIYETNFIYHYEKEIKKIDEVIDRSGYDVQTHRDSLKERAEALRKERAKNQYQAEYIPTAEKLKNELITEANEIAAIIAGKIQNAHTAKDLYNCIDKLDGKLYRLRWALSHLKDLAENLTEFKSVDSFEAHYIDIKEDLQSYKKELLKADK